MRAARLLWLLGVVACARPGARAPASAQNPTESLLELSLREAPAGDTPSAKESGPRRRGVGFVTARVPGTGEAVEGVRVSGHRVKLTVRGAVVRTEIEEDLANDADRVLEGRYVFTLPPDASLSRLALWVDGTLVEGELVERARARAVYEGIVDDTLRPRDPALLERNGGRLSLRVFPIPPQGKRTVVLAYDTLVAARDGRARVPVPLPAEGDGFQDVSFEAHLRGLRADEVQVEPRLASVRAEEAKGEAVLRAPSVRAASEVAISLPGRAGAVQLDGFRGSGDAGFFSLRLTPASGERREAPEVAIVLDRSAAQTGRAFESFVELALGVLRARRGRFVVLACESACSTYPTDGTLGATEETIAQTARFLRSLRARGSSDLGGALAEAASRLSPGGQLVYLGSGVATAGPAEIARVLRDAVSRRLDVRLLGGGARLDETKLRALAQASGALYQRIPDDAPVGERAARVADALSRPVLTNVKLTLPAGLTDVHPAPPEVALAGEPLVFFGRVQSTPTGDVRLDASLDGVPSSISGTARFDDAGENGVLPRLWAEAKIATLEAEHGDDAAILRLSKAYRVASRLTSFLVLENDAMFDRFGIARTSPAPEDGWGLGLTGAGHAWGSTPSPAPTTLGAGAGSRIGGTHVVKAPQVRAAATSVVSGRVPPEIIQRVVRMSFGRFRACYETGLMRDPTLRGRVVTKFLINRHGEVLAATDAGSDLGDKEVIDCVARAFTSLAFPEADRGTITVVYPIVFTNEILEQRDAMPLRAPMSTPRAPSSSGMGSITTTAASDGDLSPAPQSTSWNIGPGWPIGMRRSDLDAQISNLFSLGRFDEAFAHARRWSELDLDSAQAQRMLSIAAALVGDGQTHAFALDAAVDASPDSYTLRTDAARAFEEEGDERRACSHWRALSDASPWGGEARYQALRCRARLGEAAAVAREAKQGPVTDERLPNLARALERGEPAPPFDAKSEGELEARLTCAPSVAHCPELAIVSPGAGVFLRATPGPSNAIVRTLHAGRYFTLAIGGDETAKGKLVVKTPRGERSFALTRGGGTHVVALTEVR